MEKVEELTTIENQNIGDVYKCKEDLNDYIWNGQEWVNIGQDADFNSVMEKIDNINEEMQQKATVSDLSKDYTGTNIVAPTVAGCGRIKKIYGKTVEEGTGEKSLDNPYTLKCVGDDVNLFEETSNLQTTTQYVGLIEGNFSLVEGETYTVSFDTTNNSGYVYLNENVFSGNTFSACNGTRLKITATALKTNSYTDVAILKSGSKTSTAYRITNLKIQKGSVATPYSPYGYGTVENISQIDTSLLTKLNLKLETVLTSAETASLVYFKCVANVKYEVIKKAGKRLALCFTSELPNAGVVYTNGIANNTGSNLSITPSRDGYICLLYHDSSVDTESEETIFNSIKITSSSIVYVDKPLCNIGDVRDELDYTNKKITRRCGYKVFDGTESWQWNTEQAGAYLNAFNTTNTQAKSFSKVICNYFTNSKETTWVDKNCGFNSTGTTIWFKDTEKFTTLEEWTTYLQEQYENGTPVIVMYEIVISTIESIECSDKIVQYAENTTVYNKDGAEIEVELTNNETISELNENVKNVEEKQELFHTYSTEETVIGKWIDGKPLYRKVIDIGNLPNNTSKDIYLETTYSKYNFVRVYGYAKSEWGTIPLPFVSESEYETLYIVNNGSDSSTGVTSIRIRTNSDKSTYVGVVILEYTKTTD